jgi:hypothetical protein
MRNTSGQAPLGTRRKSTASKLTAPNQHPEFKAMRLAAAAAPAAAAAAPRLPRESLPVSPTEDPQHAGSSVLACRMATTRIQRLRLPRHPPPFPASAKGPCTGPRGGHHLFLCMHVRGWAEAPTFFCPSHASRTHYDNVPSSRMRLML